jgi:hypothetical protein
MPILLGFLGCERVIFEQDTNKVSIIGVLNDVFIPVLKSVPVPPATLAPLSWTALTIWYQELAESNSWFEQMVVLTGSSGEALMTSEVIRFQMHNPVMRVVSRFPNFPVYRDAQCFLRLYIRHLGIIPPIQSAANWQEMMAYPIRIHHT